jgi:hypothetical protein
MSAEAKMDKCVYSISMVILVLFVHSAIAADVPQKPAGKNDDRVVVRGIVVDFDGKKQDGLIYGAYLNTKDGEDTRWYTDWRNNYSFKLLLKPGVYKIWTRAAKAYALTLNVPKGAKRLFVKVIGRTDNAVIFRVLAPDGKPLANKTIDRGADHGPMRTDSRGIGKAGPFDMDVEYYDLLFAVSGVGYAPVSIPGDKLFRKDPIVVRLRSSGIYVSGKVVSKSTGRPLGGVEVYPLKEDDGAGIPASWWNTLYGIDCDFHHEMTPYDPFVGLSHDGDGAFRLGPIPPGKYRFKVILPNAADDWVPVDVTGKEHNVSLVVKGEDGKAAGELSGRILASNGRSPLALRDVEIDVLFDMPEGDKTGLLYPGYWTPIKRYVKTDKDGNFTLYPILPYKYIFEFSWSGYLTKKKLTISSHTPRVDLVLKKPKAVKR